MATEAAILIGSFRSDFDARNFATGMHGNGNKDSDITLKTLR